MEQTSTTADVPMSRMTIWISAPASRPKLRPLRRGSTLRPSSFPRDILRTKRRCIRIRATHTSTLQMTVARMRMELKPAYM